MQILSFSDFAHRRQGPGRAANSQDACTPAPVTDRWAQLHSPAIEIAHRSAEIVPMNVEADVDFWNDLQFRIAYPTHRLRHH